MKRRPYGLIRHSSFDIRHFSSSSPRGAYPVTLKNRLAFLIIPLLLAVLGYAFVVHLLEARQAARNSRCRGRLGQIALMLDNYVDANGALPASAITNDNGMPLLSWRAAILRHSNPEDTGIDFSQDWKSPTNIAIGQDSRLRFDGYFHSENDTDADSRNTSFVGLGFATSDLQLVEKGQQRILIIEVCNTGIHWMEPRELGVDEVRTRVLERLERGDAVHFLTADGRIGTMSNNSIRFYGDRPEVIRKPNAELFREWTGDEKSGQGTGTPGG